MQGHTISSSLGAWEVLCSVANLVEQVCRGKLPACHPPGILAACAGKEPGPRCEEKQKQGEEKGKEGKSPKRNEDNMTRHRGSHL